jgi:hypothetical protein
VNRRPDSAYPVEVGRGTLPSWEDRGRSALGLLGMIVLMGMLTALAIGVVVLLVAVIVSAAIN